MACECASERSTDGSVGALLERAWPKNSPFPPMAPWAGAVVARAQLLSTTTTQEARRGEEYQGATQWDAEVCDSPILLALLKTLLYYAVTEYCEDLGCELGTFEFDEEQCKLEFKCECPENRTPPPLPRLPPGGLPVIPPDWGDDGPYDDGTTSDDDGGYNDAENG